MDSIKNSEAALSYMPYLLQDLESLGCSVDQVTELIGRLNLVRGDSKILDLGCGKGAAGIQIAARFGIKITGIDLMEEFLQDARKKAEALGISELCSFIREDIYTYIKSPHRFDAVILASLGNLFGTLNQTVEKLRTQITTGGYMIINDAFLKYKNKIYRKGYEHYRNHEESIRALTSSGDRLLEEIDTSQFCSNINREYLERITRRGRELISSYPEMKNEIGTYLNLQVEECEVINREIIGVLWLLQKN